MSNLKKKNSNRSNNLLLGHDTSKQRARIPNVTTEPKGRRIYQVIHLMTFDE